VGQQQKESIRREQGRGAPGQGPAHGRDSLTADLIALPRGIRPLIDEKSVKGKEGRRNGKAIH
jgi:hypothetical protein